MASGVAAEAGKPRAAQPGKRFTLTLKTKTGEKPSVRLLGAGSEDLARLPNLSLDEQSSNPRIAAHNAAEIA